MHFKVVLEGAGPGLVMNSVASMEEKPGVKRQAAEKLSKPDEAESVAYRLPPTKKFPKGEFYIPSEWVKAAILNACAIVQLDKSVSGTGRKSSAKPWIAAGMWIEPGKIPLGTQDGEVYVTACKIPPRTGATVLKARYRITKWKVEFNLMVSDIDVAFANIARILSGENGMRDILVMAGAKAGIGDNRPSSPNKPGPHGTFRVLCCDFVE